jgi:beta-glucanase (GH16 family)
VLGGNATLETGKCTEDGLSNGPERHLRREALRKRALERRDPTNPYNETMGWNHRELSHDEIQPPVAILPDSVRYEFDPEQNYVSWSNATQPVQVMAKRTDYVS